MTTEDQKCDAASPCSLAWARLGCFALTVLVLPGAAFGQSAASTDEDQLAAFGPKSGDPEEEFGARQRREPDPLPSGDDRRFSARLSLDVTTAYFFRGFRQEVDGVILQPAFEVSAALYSSDDLSITPFIGIWNSIHTAYTGVPDDDERTFRESWYEADLYVGVGAVTGPWGASLTYLEYTSPSDTFQTISEVLFGLSYDDASLWGESGFSLAPSVSFALETGADYTDGASTDRGTYLQLGLSPSFAVNLDEATAIDISFPVAVGLSLGNYYEDATGDDQTLGFVSVGAKGSIPLPIGGEWGAWSLSAGVQVLFLNGVTQDVNEDESTQVLGTVGVTLSF